LCTTALKSNSLTTVFAPTGAAFKKLPAATRQELWKPGSKLRDIFILGQMVFGDILSSALKPSQDLETPGGSKVHVTRTGTSAGEVIKVEMVTVEATVMRKDLIAANGVADTNDTCLAPDDEPTPAPAPPSPAPPMPPAPAPPTTYKCIKSKCTASAGGLNASYCKQICG
jgi:uncharacterized surface protein with fasciclin (FAS1) repeats